MSPRAVGTVTDTGMVVVAPGIVATPPCGEAEARHRARAEGREDARRILAAALRRELVSARAQAIVAGEPLS